MQVLRPSRARAFSRAALLFLLSPLAACLAAPPPEGGVTPQRPTLSSDTNTTAWGSAEIEFGTVLDEDDRFELPGVLKFGTGPNTEIFVGGLTYGSIDDGDEDVSGPGDMIVGFRQRFREDDGRGPSTAVQLTTSLPTGESLDGPTSGELDFFAAGIVSKDLGGTWWTGFYQLGVLGKSGEDGSDIEHGLAIAASRPIDDRFGAYAELAGLYKPALDEDQTFTTLGVTYTPYRWLSFDAGVRVGLSSEAPDFQFVIGLTQNLGLILPGAPVPPSAP